jgi:hypothetical protein
LPTFKNSIVMGSGGSSAWKPAFGIDGLGNLDVNPMLGQLQDNGGSAPTMLPGGPAIDAGLDSACNAAPVSAMDQRGVARPVAAHCDIGAVEASALILSITDHALYATGGQENYYVVSLVNSSPTDTFSGIQMHSESSSALDASNMSWNCEPIDPASLCSTGSGTFNDIATLPPSAILVWVIGVPVLTGSNDPATTFRIIVSGAGAANDRDILTIFRGGFEAP